MAVLRRIARTVRAKSWTLACSFITAGADREARAFTVVLQGTGGQTFDVVLTAEEVRKAVLSIPFAALAERLGGHEQASRWAADTNRALRPATEGSR